MAITIPYIFFDGQVPTAAQFNANWAATAGAYKSSGDTLAGNMNVNLNQLVNFCLERLTANPGTLTQSRAWYRTDLGRVMIGAGTTAFGFGPDEINILDKGAVAGGTADCTAALQAAHDALPSTGGRIYCPRGIYKFLTVLSFTKPIIIYGDGIDVTILRGSTEATSRFGIHSVASLAVLNMTIDRDVDLTTIKNMIPIRVDTLTSSGKSLIVDRVKTRGWNWGVYADGGGTNQVQKYLDLVSVTRCDFKIAGVAGIAEPLFCRGALLFFTDQNIFDNNSIGDHAVYGISNHIVSINNTRMLNGPSAAGSQAVKLNTREGADESYVATASQTTFAYNFQIDADTDLAVFKNSVRQTLTTHYTVTGVGNPSGGNVVFGTGCAAGDAIFICLSENVSDAAGIWQVDNCHFSNWDFEVSVVTTGVCTLQRASVRSSTIKTSRQSAGSDPIASVLFNPTHFSRIGTTSVTDVHFEGIGKRPIYFAPGATAKIGLATVELCGVYGFSTAGSGTYSGLSTTSTGEIGHLLVNGWHCDGQGDGRAALLLLGSVKSYNVVDCSEVNLKTLLNSNLGKQTNPGAGPFFNMTTLPTGVEVIDAAFSPIAITKLSIDYSALTAAATTQDITLCTLRARQKLIGAYASTEDSGASPFYHPTGTITCKLGNAAGGDDYLVSFTVTGSSATTVDADSNSGQKVLNVASTTGFEVGSSILIHPGGARQEVGVIASISAGVSLTLVSNLTYTHTGAQADGVMEPQPTVGLADADLGTRINRASAVQRGYMANYVTTDTNGVIRIRFTSSSGNLGTGSVTSCTAGKLYVYLVFERLP